MEVITLSPVERLNFINQFEILKGQSTNELEKKKYDYWISILTSGYTVLYGEIFEFLSDEQDSLVGRQTIDILNMFRKIQVSIKELDTSLEELGFENLKWEGFDGNQDPHYWVMITMMDAGKWTDLQPLNSHSIASLPKYKSMLVASYGFIDRVYTEEQLKALSEAAKNYTRP